MPKSVTSVREYLSSIPNARPVQGLEGAKLWTTRGGAFVAAAPTPGNTHLLVLQTGMNDPSALAAPVLSHAIAHWQGLLSEDAPARILPSFRGLGSRFDVVVVFHSNTHGFERRDNPELHRRSFQVFPASRFEVPARLTETEAKALKGPQLVMFTDVAREPVPIVRARFQLRSYRSVGTDRALAKLSMLRSIVEELREDRDGVVELESHTGEVVRLTCSGDGYRVALASGTTHVSREDVWPWLHAFLSGGLGSAVTVEAEAPKQSGAESLRCIDLRLTLRLADGSLVDHLTEWQLRQELERLGTPSRKFAVLSSDSGHYIQCYACGDGTFDVEVRDGGIEAHYACGRRLTTDEMVSVFQRSASGQDWRQGAEWMKVSLPP